MRARARVCLSSLVLGSNRVWLLFCVDLPADVFFREVISILSKDSVDV